MELEVTAAGHCKLLVGVDWFSKWVVIWPLWTKLFEEVGDWFFGHFLLHYGKPCWVRVDAGKEFEGVFSSLCAALGVAVC